MPADPAVRSAHARKAVTERHHGPDDPATKAAAEALAAAVERSRQDEHINALIASASDPTPEQADRLRRWLNPPAPVR